MPRNPYESQRQLSPELAKSNPELFRARLIDSVKTETMAGEAVFDALKRRGVIDSRKITLDSTTWVSETSLVTGAIKIGTARMSDSLRRQIIFEDQRFAGEREYTYRTIHEITHLLHPKLFGELKYKNRTKDSSSITFFNTLVDMRKHGIGLSSLGSLDFYRGRGAGEQATEDHVELMNMFTIDPAYLERYLAFLGDPKHESFRKQNSLATLDKALAKHVFEKTKGSLEFFLDDSNE